MGRTPPNILMIVSDQHRPDCLGRAGRSQARTPVLDRLAAEGVDFPNAFTHIPTCCPARQSLLHGGRPETFGAHWNYDIGLPIPALDPGFPTWIQSLVDRGYASAYLGKWHVHPDATPLDFGYSEYIPLEAYASHREALGLRPVDDARWAGQVDVAPLQDSRTHWFARQAIDWLERTPADQPWHLRLDFVEPHLPSCPTAEFLKIYQDVEIEPWDNWDDPLTGKPFVQTQQRYSWGVESWTWQSGWSTVVRHYLAVISQLDDAIGRVLQALSERSDVDDTLVIYTSDHGDMAGSHGMLDKHYVLYEEALRVPLTLRWPARWEPRVDDRLVYGLLDLSPTLYELLDGSVPDRCAGLSLLHACEGRGEPRSHVVATFNGQQFGLYTQRAIRTRNWKYIWNATDIDELYDLETDPAELENLIGREALAGLVADLRAELYMTLIDQGDEQLNNEWVRRQLLEGCKADP